MHRAMCRWVAVRCFGSEAAGIRMRARLVVAAGCRRTCDGEGMLVVRGASLSVEGIGVPSRRWREFVVRAGLGG